MPQRLSIEGMLKIAQTNWTSSGRLKLLSIKMIDTGAPITAGEIATYLRDVIGDEYLAQYPAQVEENTLMAGVPDGINYSGGRGTYGIVGTNYAVVSPMVRTGDAIKGCSVTFSRRRGGRGGNGGIARTLKADEINLKTQIIYQRKDGTVHESRPFDGFYFQALEMWGGNWKVVPRSDRTSLMPQPGVSVTSMTKTVRPFMIVDQVRVNRRTECVNILRRKVDEALALGR